MSFSARKQSVHAAVPIDHLIGRTFGSCLRHCRIPKEFRQGILRHRPIQRNIGDAIYCVESSYCTSIQRVSGGVCLDILHLCEYSKSSYALVNNCFNIPGFQRGKEKSSQFYPAAHLVARAFCHSRAPRTQYLEAGKFRYTNSTSRTTVYCIGSVQLEHEHERLSHDISNLSLSEYSTLCRV